MSKKKSTFKIVKHAHRRRFQDYLRGKGREKATIGYVYWSMYLRSGVGDVFDLEESLFLADLGIGKNALRPARKTLANDGWLSKAAQKIDPLTGKWGTTAWTVNTESVAHSEGDGTAAPLTGDRSPDVGSAGDRSRGDTVVSITCTASATPTPYSSTGSPKGDTLTALSVSQSVSLPTTDVVVAAEDQNQDKTSTGSRSITEEQNQPQKPDQDFIVFDRERMATSPSELDPEERAVFDTLGSQDFVALLGIPYLFGGCEPNLCAIASVLKARNRSERWLVMLLQWVKKAEGREAKFWSSRIHTGTRGLTQLAKHLVTGELPQQFDAQLSLKDPEALQGKPYSNPLLFHDLVAEQYEPTSGGYKLKTEIREHEAKVKDWNEKYSTDYTLDELRPKAKAATVGFDEEEA